MITIGSCTLPFTALASRSDTDLEQRFGGGGQHYPYTLAYYYLWLANVRIADGVTCGEQPTGSRPDRP